MFVGGNSIQFNGDEAVVGLSKSAVMLMSNSTEYCYSNVGPIKTEKTGNVGKVFIKNSILKQLERKLLEMLIIFFSICLPVCKRALPRPALIFTAKTIG
jgi:hypothetical protein